MAERLVHLIDPDTAFAARAAAALTARGLRVITLGDGNDLLGRADTPSLIILCIDPKRLGWALCNRIKKTPSLRAVPMIVTSGEATDKDFEDHKALRNRAEDYLRKPFTVELLVERARHLLGDDGNPDDEVPFEDVEVVVESEEAAPVRAGDDFGDHTSIAPIALAGEPMIESADEVDFPAEAPAPARSTPAAVPSVAPQSPPATSRHTPAAVPIVAPQGATAPSVTTPRTTLAVSPASPLPATLSGPSPSGPTRLHPPPSDSRPLPTPPPRNLTPTPLGDLDLGFGDVAQQVREQSRVGRLPSSDAEVTRLVEERDRLQKEIEELRAKSAAATAPASSFSREREFLNLREVINRKEREILDLRDSVDGRERQLLDLRDKLREGERARRDADDKLLSFEKELVEARERAEASGRERETLLGRERSLKVRLDEAARKLERLTQEAKERDGRQAKELEAREAQLIEQQRGREELERRLAEHKAASEQELAARAHALAQAEKALAAEREAHGGIRSAAQEAERRHHAEIDELRAAHRRELEAMATAAREQEARELARREAELIARSAGERQALEAAHHEELAARERQRHQAVAEVEERLTIARAAATAAMAAKEHELAEALAARARLDEESGRLAVRLGERDAELGEAQEQLSAAAAEVTRLHGEVQQRDGRLLERAQQIGELDAERTRLEEQILRAYQRIKDDQLTVSRARKALGIALSLLDTVEGQAQ